MQGTKVSYVGTHGVFFWTVVVELSERATGAQPLYPDRTGRVAEHLTTSGDKDTWEKDIDHDRQT